MRKPSSRALLVAGLALVLAALACSPTLGGGQPTPSGQTGALFEADQAGEALPDSPPPEVEQAEEMAPVVPPPPHEVLIDDLPVYPGAVRDPSQEPGWEWIDPRANAPFGGEVRIFTTPDPMTSVLDFYAAVLPENNWHRGFEAFGDAGGLVVWDQPSPTGWYELGVAVYSFDQSGRPAPTTLALMLKEQFAGGQGQQATPRPPSSDTPGGLVTPAPDGSTMPPAGMGLLPTPSLSMGIQGWEQWLQPGSQVAGQNVVQMAQDPMMVRVVEFARTQGGNDGGAAGIYQPLNLDVTGFQHLYVWLVGKVIYEEGGNIGNTSPQWFPEGAVQVRVKYVAQSGQENEWYHGFYAVPVSGADAVHFSQVPQGEWFRYAADLMAQPDPPVRIVELRVYGFGWEFQGQVADVNLIGATQ